MTSSPGRAGRGGGTAGPDAPGTPDAPAVLERVVREKWGRLTALLLARYRRLDLVEDALADAVEAAARRWPADGAPDNPAAWLTTAAGRRVLDRLRAEAMHRRREPLLITDAERRQEVSTVRADPGGVVEDDVLRLALMCAHPALAPESACALTLRLVLGVSTHDIARLFLVSEPTMAARLTRAKKKIVTAGVPFAIPDADALPERLDVLAQVAYLAFTAAYAPPSGPDALRPEAADEAVRLVRVLLAAAPGEPVLVALLALELLQHSRRDARVDASGALVLLRDQDRGRWHHAEIAEAVALLAGLADAPMGALAATYALQAHIAAEHATAPSPEATRWDRIVATYDSLLDIAPSPPARLARAVAVAEAEGAQAGLAALDGLADDPALASGHRMSAVRAEFLGRLGRRDAARAAYDEALSRCPNAAEAAHLRARRDELGR